MHRPRHLAVVGIGAASGEEPRVLVRLMRAPTIFGLA